MSLEDEQLSSLIEGQNFWGVDLKNYPLYIHQIPYHLNPILYHNIWRKIIKNPSRQLVKYELLKK